MLRFILFSFLTLPIQNVLRLNNVVRMNNVDVDFNQDLNYIVTSIGAIGYILPKLLRNNEICNTDDDCPLIMRCCEVGIKKFCCTPNNFVKIELSYLTEPVKEKQF